MNITLRMCYIKKFFGWDKKSPFLTYFISGTFSDFYKQQKNKSIIYCCFLIHRGGDSPTLQQHNYNKHHYNIHEIIYQGLACIWFFYLKHWDYQQSSCFLLILSLPHWDRVTYICVGKLTIIGSDNDLSPERRQAIIWTNAAILLIGPLGTNIVKF